MSETSKRERFGRYLLLDHLVDGGMAKICRARFLGEQADKIVAIKMVQSQFSKNEAFQKMFMDEIKVTFGLHHPNIVQTYDYGMHKGQLFVAMEYCDGKNLKQYLDKLRERRFVFPIQISSYIISQACQGLHYAHTFRDKLTGVEANIIHRDISPHNIMLTYDGSVKIIDFGIAKSQSKSEETQAGTIKGKLSYLAPEYLEGLELDPRYDQFALGITLWEMLCSRKLFKENNDLAVLKKIQECKIPAPSSINPHVPKELDEIVLKALSKDRNKRFENLDQMNRALMKFLYSTYSDFNATDLSYFSQELFKDEIKSDRQRLFEFGKIDLKPYLDDYKREQEKGTGHSSQERTAIKRDTRETEESVAIKKESVLDFGFEVKGPVQLTTTSTNKKGIAGRGKVASSKRTDDDGLVEKFKTKNKSEITLQSSSRSRSDVTRRTKLAERTEVENNKKDEKKSSGLIKLVGVLAAVAVGVYFFLPPEQLNALMGKQVAPTEHVERVPAQNHGGGNEHPRGNTLVSLNGFDKQKMRVFLDGEIQHPDIMGRINAPVGRATVLRVEITGRQHFIEELNIMNNSEVMIDIPNMPYALFSYLNTKTCKTAGTIRYKVFGESRESKIPMNSSVGVAFPLEYDRDKVLPTQHDVYFSRAGQKFEKKITITFQREDQSVDLCEFI